MFPEPLRHYDCTAWFPVISERIFPRHFKASLKSCGFHYIFARMIDLSVSCCNFPAICPEFGNGSLDSSLILALRINSKPCFLTGLTVAMSILTLYGNVHDPISQSMMLLLQAKNIPWVCLSVCVKCQRLNEVVPDTSWSKFERTKKRSGCKTGRFARKPFSKRFDFWSRTHSCRKDAKEKTRKRFYWILLRKIIGFYIATSVFIIHSFPFPEESIKGTEADCRQG